MGPTGYTYAVFAASPCLDHGVQLDIPLGFPGGSVGKESACSVGELCSIPGLGRCPGEGNGNLWQPTPILAQRIPWTEEPCELQSMGSQESDMT